MKDTNKFFVYHDPGKEILFFTNAKFIRGDHHACTMVVLASKKIKNMRVQKCLGSSLERSENKAVLTFLGLFTLVTE